MGEHMTSWSEFESAEPEMAALGLKQLRKFGLAYLATVRKDGAPRVHPVCPFLADGRLFVATPPASPKRLDLVRDGRYVIHMLPGKNDDEFLVRGRARRITDAATRGVALAAAQTALPGGETLNVDPEDWLFEYDVEGAATGYWENVGQPNTRAVRRRWQAPSASRAGAPAPISPGTRAPAVTWAAFSNAAPEMAGVGLALLEKLHIAYLATVRKDGAPRVHPVSPIIADGRLFVATPPASPKRLDLRRDGRYVIHMLPGEDDGEMLIRGHAVLVEDDATRAAVVTAASHTVRPDDWLFEYHIESAASTVWWHVGRPDTRPIRERWQAG